MATVDTGSPFGTTSLNSVVFQAGSLYQHIAGANPFGASSPNSVVTFQAGSRYRLDGAITPSMSGRTYADFEYNNGGSQSPTGGNPVTVDSLVITQGTFNLNLTNASGNATIADATGIGTIVNDDQPVIAAPSQISIGDFSLAEGNAGQTAFRFTVTLDQAQTAPVTVDYSTADGTATAPSDYTATSGTLTFAAGETAKTVTVQVNGDTAVEPDETLTVNLANAVGSATIADAQAVGTIGNDDRAVTVQPPVLRRAADFDGDGKADIAVFDPSRVRDMATFEQPHQYAQGFSHVIVNGQIVYENGTVTSARPGRVIYGPGKGVAVQ